MRTLQRLQHRRPPGPRRNDEIKRLEHELVARKERRVWLNRARRIGPWLLIGSAVAAVTVWIAESRTVVDGLVRANLVVARAPADVRVAEVYARPGDRCRKGAPLVRLEGLVGKDERRALALEVERRALRLELARSGGELEITDLGRRRDQAQLAEIEARVAEADRATAAARLEARIREKASESLALRQQHDRTAGEVAATSQRVREADARVEASRAGLDVAGFDAESTAALKKEGITAERDVLSSRSEHERALSELESEEAAAEALRRDLSKSRRQSELAWEEIQLHADQTDAEIEAGRREIAALAARRDAWSELAELRRELLPEGLTDPGRLHELELVLLETELAEAQARLDAFDRETGNVVVEAAFDGVVDQVNAAAGFVVQKEAELVSYYDPGSLSIVAYAKPGQAGRIEAGERCGIYAEGSAARLSGEIAWRAHAWVTTPPLLREDANRPAGMRLPLAVEYVPPAGGEPLLAPNQRVRLVFGPGGGWAGLGWLRDPSAR